MKCKSQTRNSLVFQVLVLLITLILFSLSPIGVANCLPETSSSSTLTSTSSRYSSSSSSRVGGVSALKNTKSFITVAIDPQDSAYFGPKSWVGYNLFEQKFVFESPWDSAKFSYEESTSSNSESRYLLIYNKETLQNSMDVSTEMAGDIYGFSVNGAVEYAQSIQTSSESTSVSVKMKTDIRSLTLPLSASNLVAMLNEDTVKLAKEDPEKFFKKYGTHFISLQQYACYAELSGKYMFESQEKNDEFKAKMEVQYKGGVFNAADSSSVEANAKSVSEHSTFQAILKGDTFEIAPKEPSKLQSWSDALVSGFSKECMAHKNYSQVRQIQIRSWANIFSDITGTAELNPGNIAILQKASLLKQITYQGYQSMASYFHNHRLAQKGTKQWTNGLGHVCLWHRDGPYTMTGPQGKTADDLMSVATTLIRQGWAPGNGTTHEKTSADSHVMNYFGKMTDEYAKYVQMANEFIPSVHTEFRSMKPGSKRVGDSVHQRYVLDVFKKPKDVVDGYVNVCLKQTEREQYITDVCKPNVTDQENIPVGKDIVIAPIVSIPAELNSSEVASTRIKVTHPSNMEMEGLPYKQNVITCPLVDKQLDRDEMYSSLCEAEAVWCTEGYSGGVCVPDEYAYPNLYIVYGIFGDTDADYGEYGYPGCSKKLF